MTDNNQNPEVAALLDDLRAHRIDRRGFLAKAAATGITMAAASALATDALAAEPGTKAAAMSATGSPLQGQPKKIETKIDVRLPQGLHLTQADLEHLSKDFEGKLIDFIKQGGGGAVSKPITTYQSVSVDKAVTVDVN